MDYRTGLVVRGVQSTSPPSLRNGPDYRTGLPVHMDQSTSPLTPEPTRLDRTGLVDWTDPPFRGRVSPGPLSPGLRSAGEVEARALAVRWLSRRRWQWGGMPEKLRGYISSTPPTALIVGFSLPFWVENHLLVETLVESSDPRKAFSRLFEPPSPVPTPGDALPGARRYLRDTFSGLSWPRPCLPNGASRGFSAPSCDESPGRVINGA